MTDPRSGVILERRSISEIMDFLEDVDRALYGADEWLDENDEGEPEIEIDVVSHPFMTLRTDPKTGRLTVLDSMTDEILSEDISIRQYWAAVKRARS